MTDTSVATFQPYLPRMVREAGRTGDDALWRQGDGSMALVDISGFTALSERLARLGRRGAEEVTDVIDSSFSLLLREAYAYGGSLLKFGGDALLLFFDGDDHHRRAAAAALDMRRQLRTMGRLATSAGLVQLRMSIGIHSGSFDFFLVGGSHRELVVSGPAASRVAQVEAAARPGQILVSAELAASLPAANLGPSDNGAWPLRGRFPASLRSGPVIVPPGGTLGEFVPVGLRLVGTGVSPEHRPVSVAFLHVGGVDLLAASEGLDAAARALDEVVRAVQRAVDPRGVCFLGTDVSAGGAKVILTAGAPAVTGNDQERLLLALREIVAESHALPVKCGVTHGHVFAGPVGPEFRRTYTVMGDAVNLAARLMADARPGQILTTGNVLAGSRTIFSTEDAGMRSLKGKRDAVPALAVGEVLGVRADLDESELPFVGRLPELTELTDALQRAGAGTPQQFHIVGPPGVGKSRLVAELMGVAASDRVVSVRCRLYQETTPYFITRAVLRELLGLDDDDALAADELARLVTRHRPQLEPWLPLIGVPFDLEMQPTVEVDQLEPEFRTQRLVASLLDLLEVAAPESLLLVIEDAQWMDDASAQIIEAVVQSERPLPWLVCITRRDTSGGYPTSFGRRLDLGELSEREARDLVEAATDAKPLLPHVTSALTARAGGNPLYLLTLLRAIADQGDPASLPDSVEALIMARIDRLPAQDRANLRNVAVLGSGFASRHAAAVLGDELVDPLDRLGEFLALDDREWVSFKSALIRDVAYEGLPYRVRADLHHRVAGSILKEIEAPEEQAELLSLHFFHARRYEEAWSYSRMAGDAAMEVHANVAAATFYQRAIAAAARSGDVAPVERAAVHEALGDAHDLAGLYDDARKAYRSARRLHSDRPLDGARLALKEAFLCERQGSLSQGLRWVRAGHRLLEGLDDPGAVGARSRLTVWYAAIRAEQGRLDEALAWATRGVEEATAGDERRSLARALLILNYAEMGLGLSTDAAHSRQALSIYEELGDLSGEANACNTLGAYAYYAGDWAGARALYERAREAHERMGDPLSAALAAANIAEILSDQGHVSDAEERLHEARRVFVAGGDRWGVALAERVLGVAASRQHRFDDADDLFDRARTALLAMGVADGAFETDVRRIESLVLRRDGAAALQLVEKTLINVDVNVGLGAFDATLHRARGEALLQVGAFAESRTELSLAEAAARGHDAVFELALTLSALERLDETEGLPVNEERSRERELALSGLGVVALPVPPA